MGQHADRDGAARPPSPGASDVAGSSSGGAPAATHTDVRCKTEEPHADCDGVRRHDW